jgi:hypothetical protein
MRPDDWEQRTIERGKYFNKTHPITGYGRADGLRGNPLHPVCTFEDQLQDTFERVEAAFKGVKLFRYHIRMPYWHPQDPQLPNHYEFISTPERLTSTSVTVVLVPQALIKNAQMRYCLDRDELPDLRERLKGEPFNGLVGNLGFRMTANLIGGRFPWSHNVRHPEFPLPTLLSYLGFYRFIDQSTGEEYAGFQGAHPAAVAIRRSGEVTVLPKVEIDSYKVTLWGRSFTVRSINNPGSVEDVMLFTPGFYTDEIRDSAGDWHTCAVEIPLDKRVNVFVANEGNGRVPVERVVQVWKGRAPVPSFGAVLSFDPRWFNANYPQVNLENYKKDRIQIQPLEGTNLKDYFQVMGGFVPIVKDGQHIYQRLDVGGVLKSLEEFGNATSPLAECGRESRNFDLRIREPAGVLIQTGDGLVGWVMFDGRHELSIGASVVDVARILNILAQEKSLDIQQAIFIDGGSAMKVYAVHSDGAHIGLQPLNRIAAGSRNAPGTDPDGLNLYSVLRLNL